MQTQYNTHKIKVPQYSTSQKDVRTKVYAKTNIQAESGSPPHLLWEV